MVVFGSADIGENPPVGGIVRRGMAARLLSLKEETDC